MEKSKQKTELQVSATVLSDTEDNKSNPGTAAEYNNTAGVYQDMGDYEKALEYYLKALSVKEKALDTEYPDTAVTYNNIASVYKAWETMKMHLSIT